jgi:NADH-quinone oxidoreductase subunit I
MTRLYGTGILRSLILSFKQMMRGTITVQYPKQKIVLPERARWAVEIKPDEDGNHKCTGCRACEKACPDYVIRLDITTNEDRSKVIDLWHYELGACMMCGLCVEACPFDAIRMGHDYELAVVDVALLNVDLLTDTPAAEPKRKAAAPAPEAETPKADTAAAAPAAEAVAPPEVAPATEGGDDV